jgi:hypothetical protein
MAAKTGMRIKQQMTKRRALLITIPGLCPTLSSRH